MFPFRDHNPTLNAPYLTRSLIVLNIAVHVWSLAYRTDLFQAQRFAIMIGMVPLRLSHGEGYLGLLTHMFVHDSWIHLGSNMLFLWIFGDNLEDQLGRRNFAIFYVMGGIMAALAQYLANPFSPVPMIGASGAIAAVMGGYLMLFPRARVDVLVIIVIFITVITIPAWAVLGIWLGVQLIQGLALSGLTGGVAYWAHAGGFIAGVIMIAPYWLRKGGPTYWTLTQGQPPHEPTHIRKSRIPRVKR